MTTEAARRSRWRAAPLPVGDTAVRFRGRSIHAAAVGGLHPVGVCSRRPHISTFLSTFLSTVAVLPFAMLGFVLARRQPRNPIGWILLFFGPAFIVSTAAGMYSDSGVSGRRPRLAAVTPCGRPSAVVGLVTGGRATADPAVSRRPDNNASLEVDAVGVPGDRRALGRHHLGRARVGSSAPTSRAHRRGSAIVESRRRSHGVTAVIQHVVLVGYLALVLSWVLRLLLVYRGSVGDLRQQLKWLMVGGALCVVGILAGAFLSGVGRVFIGVLAFPVCIGIAILKYRLYDIDRLISRTLSYLIVTGLLVGVYIGLVALPPERCRSRRRSVLRRPPLLWRPFSIRCDAERSGSSIAASTGRATTPTLRSPAFTAALRNEIDLDLVQRDLVDVVTRSVQPAHVTVWIRSPS